ncbi:MAG: sulfotransferase [Anaerolineales bacterium]|nr:sulfotransferase [Anaerolineales bacterium]
MGPVWETYNNALLERLDLLETHTFLCEQVSLALAFAAQPAPFNELPLAMNFPLNLTDWADVTVMEQVDPIILHYHNCIDVLGYLRASPYPKVQKRIEQFNQQLHEHRRHSFDNQTFWDYRYWHNPDLGSGIGSRGPAITYKQETLQRIEKLYQPDSILDIGCGDQMVSQVLSDAIYTGVDLSPVIIERNRLNYPQRKFIAGDVLNLDLPPADFVICLDMLIHLNSESRYQATVACLVELTQHVGLISGYETPPTDPPDITFYYEPLSQTLLQAGARELQAVGHYKNVTLWAFKTDTSTRSPLLADPPAALLHKPLFVAGCMRSGTTLLADLVGEFQGVVHCPFELKHIWSTVGQVAMASPRTRDTECLQLGAADVQPGQAEKLAQAFRAEMMKYKKLEDQPNLIFLNKNPHLCNKLPFVNGLFPDARFIWIYRHLPQVVASLKVLFEQVNQRQQTWHYWPEPQPQVMARCWQAFHFEPPPAEVDPARCFPGGDIKYLAEYWLENNQAIAEFFQYLPVDQKLAVREETLIEQPEDQLARCLAFLGLPLDNMVNDLDSLDPTRNQLWPSQLTMTESLSLFEFVAAHAQQIEALFPDENRAALYRDQLAALLLVSNPNTIEASPATLIPEQELTALRTEMAALTAERNDYQLQLTTIFNTRAWKLMTKAWLVSGSVRKLKTLIRNKLV